MCKQNLLMRGATMAAALFALTVPALAAEREAGETSETAPTLLVVQKLHDAGGLAPAEKGQQPLNDSLTTGFVHYLSDHKQNFAVRDGRIREPLKHHVGQKVLSLEGDLSRMAGEEGSKDTFLLTLRLFDEGSPRHILAQWSGSARSLMYLTNNLHHDTRFSTDGLLGEIGGRVVQTAQAFGSASRDEQQKHLTQMLTQMKAAGDDLQVKLLSGDGNAEDIPGLSLKPGEGYRLSLHSHSDAEICVLSKEDGGLLHTLLVPGEGHEQHVMRDQTLILPTEGKWHAPEASQSRTLELVILEHRLGSEITNQGAPADSVQQTGLFTIQGAPSSQGMGLEAEPDVQVINGGNRLLPRNSGDSDLDRLMSRIQADPSQTWRIIRVKVKIASKTVRKVLMLGVGIDRYPHIPGADLEFARQDAERMTGFWKGLGAETHLLVDADATREAILKAWTDLLGSAQPTDLVILHWSGQSTQDKESTLLVPADAQKDREETDLPLKEMAGPISRTRAAGVLLVFDVDHISATEIKLALFDPLGQAKSAPSVGVFAGKGSSFEDTDLKSGILTYGMLNSLKKQSISNYGCTFLPLCDAAINTINTIHGAEKVQPVKVLFGTDFPIFPEYISLKK